MKLQQLLSILLIAIVMTSCGNKNRRNDQALGQNINPLGGTIGGTNISIASLDQQFPCMGGGFVGQQGGLAGRVILSAQAQLGSPHPNFFTGQANLTPNAGAPFGGNTYVGITANNDLVVLNTQAAGVQNLTLYMCRDGLFNEQTMAQMQSAVYVEFTTSPAAHCPFDGLLGMMNFPGIMMPQTGPLTELVRQIFIAPNGSPMPLPGICNNTGF